AILFPVFAQAREKARAVSCLSNTKQIGLAILMYGQDYDETIFPYRIHDSNPATKDQPGSPTENPNRPKDPAHVSGAAQWRWFFAVILNPYVKNDQVWRCPSNPKPWVGIDPACDPAVGDDSQPTAIDDGCSYGGQNSYGVNHYVFQPNSG